MESDVSTGSLAGLMEGLKASAVFAHKRDIANVLEVLRGGSALKAAGIEAIDNGDDCAALDDSHGGYLLFAMEGMLDSFVRALPWFAGYSAVMVNVSDVYAMGGRPLAVIDAIWSTDAESAVPVLCGMRAAAERYGVPLVGGHTNQRAGHAGLAVAILGRANKLLAAAHARAGDVLIMAVDLRGAYVESNPFWNASTDAPAHRLRADLDILPSLAEDELCKSAKDISMAGPLGSTLMLLESAGLGAEIDLCALPIPTGVEMQRWLLTFPSYGFVLAVRPEHQDEVLRRFQARHLAAARIGIVTASQTVMIRRDRETYPFWDFSTEALTGSGSRPHSNPLSEAALCP